MFSRSLWLVLVVPSLSFAAAPTAGAQAAKAALTPIQRPGNLPDLATQVRLIITELTEEVYALPEPVRLVHSALVQAAQVNPDQRVPMLQASLDETAKPFLKAACGTDEVEQLVALPQAKLVTTCHLKERKALPSKLVPSMQAASLLWSAYLTDLLTKRGASADELTLARWVAHFARTDEAGPAITKP